MKINAVSYARFSSNNQREASIEIQQEHINKYCKDNGITIIKEYVDRAFSATSDNRPQFQQMIKDAESGLFSYVIIYNSSRFCRNIQDHLRYRAILESFGVKLISVQEGFDDSTPEGDLMSNFMMSINQYYSKDLGRKTYLGCLETAKSCRHVGGVPLFGYKVNDEQKYEINEEEAKIVRLVFDMVDKNHSYNEVCSKLDEMGARTRKGKKFRRDFSGMLRNRKYIGEFVWNLRRKHPILNRPTRDCLHEVDDVVRIPHGIPAIISEEQFYRVQKIVDQRTHTHVINDKKNYLLTSLVRCGCCGYKMYVDRDINGNGKGSWVRMDYRCYSNSKRRAECNTKSFRVQSLDTYITNLLFNVLLNERYSKQIYRLIKQKLGEEYENGKRSLIDNQLEIDKTKSEIQNLISSLADAKPIVYQEIINEIEKLTHQKETLESKMVLLKKELDEYPFINEEIVFDSIIKMKSEIKSRTVGEIKPVLKYILKEIVLSNEEVQVKVNLNAYLHSKSNSNLEISIVEKTENVKNPSNQFKQGLSWNTVIFQI